MIDNDFCLIILNVKLKIRYILYKKNLKRYLL